MNRQLSTFIDLSRWLSAFLVILGHAAHILILPISHDPEAGLGAKTFFLLAGLGHEAVVVFFIISGYLVGGITLNKWLSHGPNVVDYAINRFARIYAVLIPALITGLVFDFSGMHWFNSAELYTNTARYNIGSLDDISMRLNLVTFIGNILMLEGNVVTSFGSNGPLWSLAYEWWYYCLFCVLAAGLVFKGKPRFYFLTSAILLAVLVPGKLLLWMLIWLMGVGTFFACRKTKAKLPFTIALILFSAIALLSAVCRNFSSSGSSESLTTAFIWDAVVGLAYCILLTCAGSFKTQPQSEKFHQWAAGFSYSMYLFHFPALLFIVAAGDTLFDFGFLHPLSPLSLVQMLSVISILYVIGYIFSRLTEKRTDLLRLSLKKIAAALPFLHHQQPVTPTDNHKSY